LVSITTCGRLDWDATGESPKGAVAASTALQLVSSVVMPKFGDVTEIIGLT